MGIITSSSSSASRALRVAVMQRSISLYAVGSARVGAVESADAGDLEPVGVQGDADSASVGAGVVVAVHQRVGEELSDGLDRVVPHVLTAGADDD